MTVDPIRRLFVTLAILAGSLAGSLAANLGGSAHAADLTEIYHRALRNDPQLREAEDTHLAALEARPQAFAALLPQIGASAGYTHDNQDSEVPGYEVGSNTSFFRTLTKSDTTQWGLSLRQTVFRWDQIVKLKQSDLVVAQAEATYRSAQQSVIVRSAQAYFNVLAARDLLDYATASKEAIAHQLEQAQKRFEVGLIAITDVEEAKAAADQATATVIAQKRALALARDQLRELTGDGFDELTRPGDDMPLMSPDPASEDAWVSASLSQNPDLIAARLAADVARENITIARTGHAPTIDIVASKTFSNTSGNATIFDPTAQFPADSLSHDSQIGLQITVPLYSGGLTSSRIRETIYLHRAARERLERTARATERSARDSYRSVLSEVAQIQALKQALSSQQTALQATEAGYDVGTRTAVDVLIARQNLFNAQSNYASARYSYILDVLTLEQAAGMIDEARLTRVNTWLNQKVSIR